MLFCVTLAVLFVLFGCGDAQCDFPDDNNLANAVSDAIGATIVRTNVLCLTDFNIKNEYSNATVAVEVTEFDFCYFNFEVICVDGINGSVWNFTNYSITNATSLDLPLMEPCSSCTVNILIPEILSEAVCSPCHSNCSEIEFGSGRCFGSGADECCPFYSIANFTCLNDCSNRNIDQESFVCLAEFFFINETMIEVDESIFQLTLCTELGGAVLSQDIYIQLMDTPSTTAQPGTDYVLPTPFEVFYPAGSEIGTQKCVNISIVDDDTFEGTHNFTVNLLDPGNPCCNAVSPSTIQIDILDDDEIIDGCEAETGSEYGILWLATSPNTTAQEDCGGPDVIGLATRYCNGNGEWLTVNASSCISRVFQEINASAALIFVEELSTLNSTELEVVSLEAVALVNELAVATQDTDGTEQSLFPSELAITNDVLFETIQILNASFNANGRSTVNTTSIADTLNNVLDTRNQPGWNSVQDNNPTMGPELLLDNIEDFGLFLATSLDNDTSVTIARDNIVITAMLILVEDNTIYEDVTFPTQDVVSSEMLSGDSIFIPNELVEARASGRVILPISNILLNTVQNFLQDSSIAGTIIPGTRVISSQVGVQRGNIDYTALLQDSPVNITLGVQVENFSGPSCVFWQFSSPIGTGFWSSEGITTVSVDGGETVICLSNHLTSFAVLVDTAGTTPSLSKEERTALSIVSYILLTISVVFLILTVISFLSFGKELFTSVHYFVHLNFALALLIAFCVFLFGIESAVDNRVACTFIAALLHYFFLSAFCWMLCEGVMLYLLLVVVFSSLSKKWWFFLILGWIPPIIPVVVTVGVTHDYYTDAEFFCWLSADRNVIWAFTVPMIIIIIINTVFLVFVMITLVKNKGSQNARKLEENKRVDIVISTIKASIILLPLLGLTWLFGLLAVNQQTSFLAWLFVILNASQGTAIFILHVVRDEKIRNRLVKLYNKLSFKGGEYSTTGQSSDNFQKKGKYLHKEKDNTLSTSDGTSHEKEKFQLAPIATIDNKGVSVVDEKSKDFHEELDIDKQPLVSPKHTNKLSIIPSKEDQNETSQEFSHETQTLVEEGLDYSLRYSIKRSTIKTKDVSTHS